MACTHNLYPGHLIRLTKPRYSAIAGAISTSPHTELELTRTRISDCSAIHQSPSGSARGGGIFTEGKTTLIETSITACSAFGGDEGSAKGEGGGIFVSSASSVLLMKDGTQLSGNNASSRGKTYFASGGTSTYQLPAAPGYWIAARKCAVYRDGCVLNRKSVADEWYCPGIFDECSKNVDPPCPANVDPPCPPLKQDVSVRCMTGINDTEGEVCKQETVGGIIKRYAEYPRPDKWPDEDDEPAEGTPITWNSEYCKGNETCETADYKKFYDGVTEQVPCRNAKTSGQPCDWENQRFLLGHQVETLPAAIELDYPYVCTPGVLGGRDAEDQTSSVCARLCTPGKFCEGRPTLEEQTCPAGFYCPLGSPVPLPCKPGTYSNYTGLSAPEQCTICPPVPACSSLLHSFLFLTQPSLPPHNLYPSDLEPTC